MSETADTGPGTFAGAHDLVRLVLGLCARPRYWRKNRDQEIRGETTLPLVICLRSSPEAVEFLGPLETLLRKAGPTVTAVRIDAEKAEENSVRRWEAVTSRDRPLLPLLDELRDRLAIGSHDRPRLTRFHLYRFVDMLTGARYTPAGARDDRVQVTSLIWAWYRGKAQSGAGEMEPAPDPITWLLLFLLRMTPLPRRARTYFLRFSPDARWLMRRQHFMTPKHSLDFPDFAERLSGSRRASESDEQLKKLLVHTFLEDLRRTYRRRKWKIFPHLGGWRRTAYVAVLLENVNEANGGWELLQLINAVRNETGEIDPLLVIAESRQRPPTAGPAMAASSPGEAYAALTRWRRSLPSKRQRRTDDARHLLIELPPPPERPAALPAADRDVWADDEAFPVRRPPVLARPLVLTSVVAVLAAGGLTPVATTAWELRRHHCLPLRETADVRVDLVEVGTDGRQCVGLSTSKRQIFGDNPRLKWAQEAVHDQNETARKLHRAEPGRPYVSLVYFAAFTHRETDVDTDHAIADELEGLLLRQWQLNHKSKIDPLLRIIVANGGHEMRAAQEVAERMIVPLAERDPSVLGVVGLDRTVKETERAISEIGGHGIPLVATTLTGSGLLGLTPLYFQLVPGNDRQAELVGQYAKSIKKAEKVTVYHPGLTPRESYIRTLVDAMKAAVPGSRFEDWGGSVGNLTKLCADQKDRSRELVYYVGREDDFGDFLTQVTGGCDRSRLPEIIGADAVSRFIAHGESRSRADFSGLPVDYVGMGGLAVLGGRSCLEGRPAPVAAGAAMSAFCTSLSALHRKLTAALPKEMPGPPWPGERVGLAYDAAGLFVEAVKTLRRGDGAEEHPAPHRAAVAQIFREPDFTFQGVTGPIGFSGTRVGNLANLAILRIAEVNDLKAQPSCVYMLDGAHSADRTTHCPVAPKPQP